MEWIIAAIVVAALMTLNAHSAAKQTPGFSHTHAKTPAYKGCAIFLFIILALFFIACFALAPLD